jgi:signal transduction histidine kinase/ActR/RegA family two-component response regulator
MIALLLGDPVVRISLLALALQVVFLSVLPTGPRATAGYWSDSILLAVNLWAAERAARKGATGRERRFWRVVVGAGALWFLASLIDVVPVARLADGTRYVATDALFLAITFLLIVALGLRPDRWPQGGPLGRAIAIDHLGTATFAFALLAYFVVVPFTVNKPIYATLVPSMSAFVLLDVFLVGRAAWLARGAAGQRWRAVYRLLGLGFLASLIHDSHQLADYLRRLPSETGSAWDIVWTLQFVALASAAAASRLVPREADADVASCRHAPDATPVTSLVPFAFALPLVHLVGGVMGFLDPLTENAREMVVLAVTPALGALAIAHQALLERRHQQVRQDLLATQEELQASRKMEALGRLAGGVSHDFNHLLAVILGYSDMLLERRRDDERVTGPVEEIRQAAERALALTRQLTIFSQRRFVEGRALALDAAVAAIAPLLGRLAGPGISVECRAGAGRRSVSLDLHQFERVLINLVANACEAVTGGGRIVIETSTLTWGEDDRSRSRALAPGSYLRLVVRDTGSGMEEGIRTAACDPFFTTKDKHEHPGLGLSVVYGIVAQAGGIVEIDSAPGEGTTVSLVLPEIAGVAAEAPAEAQAVPRGGQATVLLAEDDESFRELMRVTLEREGYRVLEAADGRAALEVAARYEGRIDLLMTDVIMPGVDGRRLAERLLPGRPEMRVLFVSGYAGDLLSDIDALPGRRAFLQKPFTMQELARRVSEVTGVRPTATV